MRNVAALILALSATAGCATLSATPSNQPVDGSSPNAAASPLASSTPNMAPRLVIPATGGPPTMAIPVGGNLYVPVTGGPPISGMPITP